MTMQIADSQNEFAPTLQGGDGDQAPFPASFLARKRKAGPNTRIGRSAACRNWYRRRQLCREAGLQMPLWTTVAAPWPVLRLARRLAGRPPRGAIWLAPLGLLAIGIDGGWGSTRCTARQR